MTWDDVRALNCREKSRKQYAQVSIGPNSCANRKMLVSAMGATSNKETVQCCIHSMNQPVILHCDKNE